MPAAQTAAPREARPVALKARQIVQCYTGVQRFIWSYIGVISGYRRLYGVKHLSSPPLPKWPELILTRGARVIVASASENSSASFTMVRGMRALTIVLILHLCSRIP